MGTRTEKQFLDWLAGAFIYIGRSRYGRLGGHGFVVVSKYIEDDSLAEWTEDLDAGDHDALHAADMIKASGCWIGNDPDPSKAMSKVVEGMRKCYFSVLNDGVTPTVFK